MTTTIENLITNKRKFISDDEVYPPSARILSITNQAESCCNAKKIKSVEIERLPSSIIEIDDNDDMICENSNLKEHGPQQVNSTTTDKQRAVSVPQHCNGIYNVDASPQTYLIRCYCDPYRLNAFIPYDFDIY
ncbi:unnamed protein product [Rotaria magnacalcarata]|uniref:Uncharacterized protein n=1 Tax=Rotaria magnacalcarata TaxID=392030 RepID=A0A815N058_9BILA|nr:unnamed protein product [Rotaria magnacalcarata]CAF2003063.1 unnamed protein product [Rotaria magnacalcarata]CAF2100366.1 unnamed protein product [Rotaria magnacalcarata]CAF3925451.1 unnamed protein product [Rotaria magnacalcarata]CAF4297315.1 unnamed protein product [Rotaria magnacalcarata]